MAGLALFGLLAMPLEVTTAAADKETESRHPFKIIIQVTTRVVLPASPEYTQASFQRCGGAPVLEGIEVGQVSFLAAVIDQQSHCLGPDGSSANGVFTFTDVRGRTVSGPEQRNGGADVQLRLASNAAGSARWRLAHPGRHLRQRRDVRQNCQ
jgi:hypothetical protein